MELARADKAGKARFTLRVSSSSLRLGAAAASITYIVVDAAGRVVTEATGVTGTLLTQLASVGATLVGGEVAGATVRAMGAVASSTTRTAVQRTSTMGTIAAAAAVGAATTLTVIVIDVAIDNAPALLQLLQSVVPATLPTMPTMSALSSLLPSSLPSLPSLPFISRARHPPAPIPDDDTWVILDEPQRSTKSSQSTSKKHTEPKRAAYDEWTGELVPVGASPPTPPPPTAPPTAPAPPTPPPTAPAPPPAAPAMAASLAESQFVDAESPP